MLQAGRAPVRILIRWIFSIYLILPAALWPLTELSTRNLSGGKKGPAHRADTLAVICEPNV
jgi:hypothetical protein